MAMLKIYVKLVAAVNNLRSWKLGKLLCLRNKSLTSIIINN